MKKSQLAMTTYAAVASIASLLTVPQFANATACTAGTSTSGLFCQLTATSGTFIAQTVNFTGSNGVAMAYDISTSSGVTLCSSHTQGTGNKFGASTDGGSMQVLTGTGFTTPGVNTYQSGITGICT